MFFAKINNQQRQNIVKSRKLNSEEAKKNKENRFYQICEIMKQYKIRAYMIEKEIGLSQSTFGRWRKKRSAPVAVMYALEAAVEKIKKEKIANLQIDKLKK